MQIKLSKADRIILSELEWNSKITEKELAKKCNLSKDGIRYRIKRLENKKITLGSKALIDYKKIGKESYKLYLKVQSTTKIKEIKKFLKEKKEVFAIFESKGNWNLAIALFTNTIEEYSKIENEILNQFGNEIIEKRICQMIDAIINTNKTINKEKEYGEKKIWGEKINNKIDETDKIIIKKLSKNAKTTLYEISQEANKSIETITRKKKQLEEKGIIAVYNTKINYPLLGLEIYKVFIYPKKYDEKIEKKIITYLKSTTQIRDIIRIVGAWKLEIELTIEKYEEYIKIIDELTTKFEENIRDIEYAILRDETFHP